MIEALEKTKRKGKGVGGVAKESLISSGEWNRGLSQGAQELAVDSLKKSANASLLQLDNDIFCVDAGNSCFQAGTRENGLYLVQFQLIVPGTQPTHCTWYKSNSSYLVHNQPFVPSTPQSKKRRQAPKHRLIPGTG
ncbi:hypothetical protein QTG56_08180 [Rossellomorea sp. AcN35-11]|nr:hypothetical protein QTG56_08180 [Rossellomorea sp. AcN35-11]